MDKVKLPYSLIYDPQTGKAAAYTSNHRLIAETSTKRLVSYALDHTAQEQAFAPEKHAKGAPRWRPLPAWATPETHARLRLIWIQRPTGDASDEAWLAIPPR